MKGRLYLKTNWKRSWSKTRITWEIGINHHLLTQATRDWNLNTTRNYQYRNSPLLVSVDGYLLGIWHLAFASSSSLSCGLYASPPGGSRSCSSLIPTPELPFSFFPLTCFTSHLAFWTVGKELCLFTFSVIWSGLLGKVGLILQGLKLWWEKSQLVTSGFCHSHVVLINSLGIPYLLVVASEPAIYPSTPLSSLPLGFIYW